MADSEPVRKTGGLLDALPTDRLKSELQDLAKALALRTIKSATGRLGVITEKVPGLVQDAAKSLTGGGGPGGVVGTVAKKATEAGVDKVKGAVGAGGGGGRGGQKSKVTNIVEGIDVGVPIAVAYNQWTQFTDFPSFMKKVENVEQESDTEVKWRAQILWSHRDWKSTIIEQVPEERIVWRSEGAKGYVNGAVSFHELAPSLTKILVVLEYYPQGFFEKVGNLWRAQGRRARLELKHFRRHVMTEAILHAEELEGWRGEIHDSEVTGDRQQAQQGEEQEQPERRESERPKRRRKAGAGTSSGVRRRGER